MIATKEQNGYFWDCVKIREAGIKRATEPKVRISDIGLLTRAYRKLSTDKGLNEKHTATDMCMQMVKDHKRLTT